MEIDIGSLKPMESAIWLMSWRSSLIRRSISAKQRGSLSAICRDYSFCNWRGGFFVRAILTLSASDEVAKAFALNGGDSAILNAMLKHRLFRALWGYLVSAILTYLTTIGLTQGFSNLAVGLWAIWPFLGKTSPGRSRKRELLRSAMDKIILILYDNAIFMEGL